MRFPLNTNKLKSSNENLRNFFTSKSNFLSKTKYLFLIKSKFCYFNSLLILNFKNYGQNQTSNCNNHGQ